MSVYSYKALDREGTVQRGKLTAENEAELESKLKQSELDLISSSLVRESKFTFFSTITQQELILICIHLHYLEDAGVPLLDSIADLRDNTDNPKLKQIMMDLYDSLKNGKTFSQALAMHPNVFDNIFIGLIEAGERTGNFSDAFGHLEHHFKWINDLKEKIKKATYYPMFLLLLMSGVMALMMIYVIPKLTVFLLSQNIELPFYTLALIATSDFICNHWKALIFTPILTFIIIKISQIVSEEVAYYIDFIKLNLPIIGNVIRKIEIARFCHFFSITYKSGIGILECLTSAQGVVQNKVIKKAIDRIHSDVTNGRTLTNAFTISGEFPQLVIRMFRVGEESGNLEKSLNNINVFYDAEINTSVDSMVGFMQPALTLVMGGLMMWITISVFGPIYGSFGSVGR